MAPPARSDIAAAVRVLSAGGLVAFPTETVYGLGADATNAAAVEKIFIAKGRPPTNPLIVHVADEASAHRYAAHWPDQAARLAEVFWPGPLTLVLAKSARIVPTATAGAATVGLRVPNHPLALQLLQAFDGPIAAPSANRSGRISPTTADHVRGELGNRVDLILDGGPCQVGIESTVIDMTTDPPAILRPGGVSRRQIEAIIGPVRFTPAIAHGTDPMPSPGLQAVHYSPATPMFRFEFGQPQPLLHWCHQNPAARALLLLFHPALCGKSHEVLQMSYDPVEYARGLYAVLHRADQRALSAIWAELPPDRPEWAAVRDRLLRASVST